MKHVPSFLLSGMLLCLLSAHSLFSTPRGAAYRYAVVIKNDAYNDAAWKKVADTLLKIHGATASQLFKWNSAVTEVKNDLAAFGPDYIAYVCRPAVDLNSTFVHTAHQLTRGLNSDPYYDAVFSFVTGYVAADALRAVTERIVLKTGIVAHWQSEMRGWFDPTPWPGHRYLTQQISRCEGVWNSLGTYPSSYYYFKDGTAATTTTPWNNETDCIRPLCAWLNADSIHVTVPGKGSVDGPVDFVSTSGHGNINEWMAEFPSAVHEGYIRSNAGQLTGAPLGGGSITVNCATPKVYMASGNCLIGNPDNANNLVYAWFHTGHAINMFGYIVTSGYGYNGWGDLDRMLKFPGRYNVPEAFFATMQCHVYDMENRTPGTDYNQLASYQDNVAVYGDPKADAYTADFGDSSGAYLEKLTRKKASNAAELDTFVYTVTAIHFNLTANESMYFYRGLRPFRFLPVIIDPATVVIDKNEGRGAAIKSGCVVWNLIRSSDVVARGSTKTLIWRAKVLRDNTGTSMRRAAGTAAGALLSIVPGPAGARLNVLCTGFAGRRVSAVLQDLAGRAVARSGAHNAGASLRITLRPEKPLPAGIYVLSVSDGITMARTKIACAQF